MKRKIAIIVLSLFFFLAILDGIVQSPWAKEKALTLLKNTLHESGWDVEIENIRSTFPNIDLTGVTIQAPDFVLYFGTLKADISLAALWRKEIIFTKLQGDEVSWSLASGPQIAAPSSNKKIPSFILSVHDFVLTNATLFDDFVADLEGSFSIKDTKKSGLQIASQGMIHPKLLPQDFKFSTHLTRNPDKSWSISKTKAVSKLLQLKGFGNLDSQGNMTAGTIDLQSDHFSFHSIKGNLLAHFDIAKEKNGLAIKTTWRLPSLEVAGEKIKDVEGRSDSFYENKSITGACSVTAEFQNHPWEIKTPFSWEKGKNILFSKIELESPLLKAQGALQMNQDALVEAEISFLSAQLHELFGPIYGQASGRITWTQEGDGPLVHFDTRISDFQYDTMTAKSVNIYSDLKNPLQENFQGTGVLDISEGMWGTLFLDSASIETTKEGENWPFQMEVAGNWKHPLVLDLNGFWSFKPGKTLLISLQNATGSFFNHPLLLPTPAQFAWAPNILRLEDFSLQINEASIKASLNRVGNQADATLSVKQLPLDFLSLNPLDVAIEGVFNLDVAVKESEETLQGDLTASFNDLKVLLLGQTEPLRAEGTLVGSFDRDRLQTKGELYVRETPLASLDLTLPIHFGIWPFTAELLYHKEVEGKFFLAGQIEEFLDFFNLGTHRLEGFCNCDLSLSNTLENPHLYGQCDFKDGYYQNYYTGTELKNIQANFVAQEDKIVLTTLSSHDSQKKGSFDAKGTIDLLPEEHFPFEFDVTFSRFNCATFDLITTEADGTIQIVGNLNGAVAKGHLDILESDITVPTRIPHAPPNLQVVYLHAKKAPIFELPKTTPYPLHLDLSVNAPDGIFISGRGLDSEWKGDFHVEGTQTDIATKGKIELIKGNFLFSGRAFKLTEGSLSFSGIPNTSPYLNLAAVIQVKEISITAHLKGPINNPQVTLQSSPPLPMGTIMSYLLFGQDLAEISSAQAVQLAGSIASLAGEGPGILEQTKKSLGIDRIQIITVPSSTADSGETIAVQVGKYVSEGVLVSYSQGAESTSGNISIEVELKGNLSFVLESDQADEQKQGKFTFRWGHTY